MWMNLQVTVDLLTLTKEVYLTAKISFFNTGFLPIFSFFVVKGRGMIFWF